MTDPMPEPDAFDEDAPLGAAAEAEDGPPFLNDRPGDVG